MALIPSTRSRAAFHGVPETLHPQVFAFPCLLPCLLDLFVKSLSLCCTLAAVPALFGGRGVPAEVVPPQWFLVSYLKAIPEAEYAMLPEIIGPSGSTVMGPTVGYRGSHALGCHLSWSEPVSAFLAWHMQLPG